MWVLLAIKPDERYVKGMINAHERPKQPELVRRRLLDSAADIAVNKGLAGVTIQAVAQAAGVTKGGLFHHFASKEKLIEGEFLDQVGKFDAHIDRALGQDHACYGCFTRAYVAAVFDLKDDIIAALSISMMADPALRVLWSDWMRARLDTHRDTDSAPALEIVRYAADGVWLADLWRLDDNLRSARPELRSQLLHMTRKG